MTYLASIIIPAYNEATVINRCLSAIFSGKGPSQFEVIVSCNGCDDNTADVARAFPRHVKVLETEIASKPLALNMADKVATCFPRVYLDADLVVSGIDILLLIQALTHHKKIAACGHMAVNANASSFWVRAFYNIWPLSPYHDEGKFGGVFALSKAGHKRLGEFPHVINDDEFVRRLFNRGEYAHVNECIFQLFAPRNLQDLVKIRSRVIRGNRELEKLGHISEKANSFDLLTIANRVVAHPRLWLSFILYTAINFWVRIKIATPGSGISERWERDNSSRLKAAG